MRAIALLTLVAAADAAVKLQSAPRGWNSWYNFLGASNETATLAAAQYLANNLLAYGYDTVTIDEGWSEDNGAQIIDSYGRLTWNTNNYPHGLPWLAEQLKGMGVKLGLWLVRGVGRAAADQKLPIYNSQYTADQAVRYDRNCSWNGLTYGGNGGAAAVAYYTALAQQIASWGVSLVKIDCMWPNRYEGTPQTYFNEDVDAELGAFRDATNMVVSLSPGISVSTQNGTYVAQNGLGAIYRIAEDVLDVYDSNPDGSFPQGVHQKFWKALEFEPLLGSNKSWPDFDMLQVGQVVHSYGNGDSYSETHLTRSEQVTEFTLFAVTGTPLIIGGRLPLTDDANGTWTLSLLTNAEVLALQNETVGRKSFTPISASGATYELYGWQSTPIQSAPSGGVRTYATLFNANTTVIVDASVPLTTLGFPAGTTAVCVRDLWTHSYAASVPGPALSATIDAHGARAFLVTALGDPACATGLAGAYGPQ